MSMLTDALDFGAAKKAKKKQAKIAAETARKDAVEFDSRMTGVNASDLRLDDLANRQYTDMSGLEDSTFDWMLGNNQAGFDEQQTVAGKALDDQMTALGGLMTSQRKSRLEAAAASEAEKNRQLAIQSQADALAGALPEDIGFSAQAEAFGDALAKRSGFARASMTAAEAPGFAAGGDDLVRREFEKQQQRGYGEALTDADSAARVSSYSDAFVDSERKLGDFAGQIGQLTSKAAISRSALPYELGVSALDKSQARDRYASESDMISGDAARRSDARGQYRENSANARGAYADNYGSALEDYFGKQFGSEGTYVDRLMGSSTNYANKILGLGNYKMANTTAYNPLSAILKSAEKAAAQAMTAGAGG
jgi:hypothetical protein